MPDSDPPAVLAIGVGNELRGDDGVGIEVARSLREPAAGSGIEVQEEQNDPTALLERWKGRAAVVLIDAAGPGAHPGRITRFDAAREPLPARLRHSSSTHAVGLAEAIELARALGKLPSRMVVYTVEGRSFEAGTGLSAEVAAALPALAEAVLASATELLAQSP